MQKSQGVTPWPSVMERAVIIGFISLFVWWPESSIYCLKPDPV